MGQLQDSCCEDMGLKKGPWTPEEDQILIAYINKHGHGNWRALPKQAGLLRCGKSCRLRWTNYLRPDIKRGNFTVNEEQTIIQLHRILGNRWSAIASHLPGRTDNEIKNVWNTHLRKRLFQIGVDPVTHAPTLYSPYSPHPHYVDDFKGERTARKSLASEPYNTTTVLHNESPHTQNPPNEETLSLCSESPPKVLHSYSSDSSQYSTELMASAYGFNDHQILINVQNSAMQSSGEKKAVDYTTLLQCSYNDSLNLIMADDDAAMSYTDCKPPAAVSDQNLLSLAVHNIREDEKSFVDKQAAYGCTSEANFANLVSGGSGGPEFSLWPTASHNTFASISSSSSVHSAYCTGNNFSVEQFLDLGDQGTTTAEGRHFQEMWTEEAGGYSSMEYWLNLLRQVGPLPFLDSTTPET